MNSGPIIGIDLGTTNSEVAAMVNDRITILGHHGKKMLPSCVGLSRSGELLVGETARNQQMLYPERTVRSIKRKMGEKVMVKLADHEFSPQEISSLILRELVSWAEAGLGCRPEKAVITVPAYFSDAQRQATREAGQMAGIEVMRIINEPTAASLAYGHDRQEGRIVMVYDLGGGTFDVSIVRIEEGVTEVLASHGNNHLGGDDFTQALCDHLCNRLAEQEGVNPHEHRGVVNRLWWAAEQAKQTLSSEAFTRIREDNLMSHKHRRIHLDLEISRNEYEAMISPMVESTLESVTRAMEDATLNMTDITSIILVGGSTRIPFISRLLAERTGKEPSQEVHPDLCVAMGAGVMAARLDGHEIDRVLVDVSPYTFGIRCLDVTTDGDLNHNFFSTIINRNIPLPVTRTQSYTTSIPYQPAVQIEIYQGDDPDVRNNIPLGTFTIKGLQPTFDPNVILCRFNLDLNGILNVTATEKETGLSRDITISGAFAARSEDEIRMARERMQAIYARREQDSAAESPDKIESTTVEEDAVILIGEQAAQTSNQRQEPDPVSTPAGKESGGQCENANQQPTDPDDTVSEIIVRSRAAMANMHQDDRQEAEALIAKLEIATRQHDRNTIEQITEELKELLFFVEA